jgi:exopolysaccharide biosynthesis predicted pyruvyltransferase EpsI
MQPTSTGPAVWGALSARTSFSDYLSTLDGAVFIDWLAGNNGDRLIRMGLERLLRQNPARLVDDPVKAERIILNGGGAMNDFWEGGLALWERYRRRYPDKPLTIAPSSFSLTRDRFERICAHADSPMVLYAREQISYDLLRGFSPPAWVDVRLAQDLALELRESDFIRGLRGAARGDHVLIALRADREGSAAALSSIRAPWLPAPIRRPLARLRTRLIAHRSGRALRAIERSAGIPRATPRVYCDVSVSADFDHFTTLIRDAALIVTDRLHCAVLGSMLGKRVVLRPGSYHKNQGVFEYSLSAPGSTVTLWAP